MGDYQGVGRLAVWAAVLGVKFAVQNGVQELRSRRSQRKLKNGNRTSEGPPAEENSEALALDFSRTTRSRSRAPEILMSFLNRSEADG